MEKEKTPYQQIDVALIMIVILLGVVSLIAIYSIQPSLPAKLQNINFVAKQIQWYVIGFVAIVVTMIIDFDRFKNFSWYLYGLGILLLVGLEVFEGTDLAPVKNGAVSWYDLPFIGNFQPAELMKIFLIILLSKIIAKHNEIHPTNRTVKDDLYLVGKLLGVSIIPLALILRQPDLGTSIVLAAIIGSLLLVSGIRWRVLFGMVSTVIAFIGVLVFIYFKNPDFILTYILKKHQMDRFYGWLAPHEFASSYGFQLIKSLVAIGSGQLEGKGLMNGQVYFPEAHTDFIFAVIGEQFGFIGASIVISLYFLLIYRMIHTALESHDPYGSYLCTGVIGMITFQVFQNIGMTVQLMPITGLTLPFISYGGSSLLTSMIAIGIVLNVRSRTKKYMFSD
ncbi:FtsW/RodA/SpoVE family cell cycle protein [Calidifontibacillus oryziterrae]|uniref:FtsW/RodA/SpoVE family cell cycle protein n=1 Tax=Calidifontibacillus oryziterrae TaxID=1191699 RepID=UPI000475D973|nr:FtsW/RodA/SpoVE family cell cycle protein [Calidifontibacillus oryziterrae]